MAFTVDEIPKDVQWVWNIQIACEMTKTGIGSETWNKCQRIINQYPEWFPENKKQEIFPKNPT